MDWEAAKHILNQPLDPAHVKKPSGSFGPKGDYIEGWHAINEANRAFGFGGWSYTSELTLIDQREAVDSKGKDQWQVSYLCKCRLMVGDVAREDVGYGSGFAKGIGDAHEGAAKEAATDALKRSLRTFGNIFGLALYDKAKTNVQSPFDAEGFVEFFRGGLKKCTKEAHVTGSVDRYGDDLAKLEKWRSDLMVQLNKEIYERRKELSEKEEPGTEAEAA